MSLFATKSIEQIKAEHVGSSEHSLKRVLGPAPQCLAAHVIVASSVCLGVVSGFSRT